MTLNKDLFNISLISAIAGIIWFSFQNIGIDCDFSGYINVAKFFTSGFYTIPEYSLWIRPPGYGFILWLTRTNNTDMISIIILQSLLAVATPVLLFLTINEFHRKTAIYTTIAYIISFQPFFWSKTLLTESWHIFFSVTIIYLTIIIRNYKPNKIKINLFIILNIIGILIRPTFIVITLISFLALVRVNILLTKKILIRFLIFLSFIVASWSFIISLTLPQQRIPSSKSESINLSQIQELFLYDFYLNAKRDSYNNELETLIKFTKNLSDINNRTTINIRPVIETNKTDHNPEIDDIFNNPTHLKYFYLKTILKDGTSFKEKEIIRKTSNLVILNNYILNPINLFSFLSKYITAFLSTNNAHSYLSFMKNVIETPFSTFDRNNGPHSLYLHTLLTDFFSNPKNNEQIIGIIGSKYQSFGNGWIDKDTRIFRDNIDWMQLFLITNLYLGPLDASKLIANVNTELKWTVSKTSPLNIYNVPEWIPTENKFLTFINLGFYHSSIYFFSPYLDNFGFHWNYVFCTDDSFKYTKTGLRVFNNYKKITPNVGISSLSYRDNFDKYIHYFWMTGRYIFLLFILVFIYLNLTKSNKYKVSSYQFYLLSIIFMHSYLEMFTSGSHVRYVDHAYTLYWLFSGILISDLISKRFKVFTK